MTEHASDCDWRWHAQEIARHYADLAEHGIPDDDLPDAAAFAKAAVAALRDLQRGWLEAAAEALQDPESPHGPATFDEPPADAIPAPNEPLRAPTTPPAPQLEAASGAKIGMTSKNTYSFNTAAIVAGTAEAIDGTPYQAVATLVREGALRLDWKISRLRDLARRLGLPLREVAGAVEDAGDADGPWVGKATEQKPEVR